MATLKVTAVPALKTSTPNASIGTQNVLNFQNGDLLYGQLLAIDAGQTVHWSYPEARQPIEFKLESISAVDFPAPSVPALPEQTPCQVHFNDGESFDGNLISCDTQSIILDTWQAGQLKLPRSAIQSIGLISQAPAIFSGPTGKEGWTSGKSAVAAASESAEWSYRNGAFYAGKAASIARDLKLPPVGQIQFDLAWKGSLYLAIALYTDSLQPVNLISKENEPDFGGFYSLQLGSLLDLRAITKHDPLRSLGQLIIPGFSDKTRAHIDLRISKPKGTVALFINDALVNEWKDTHGFVGQGTGMRFVHQGMGTIKLSGLRISEWDGQMPAASTEMNNPTQDVAWLRKGNRSAGAIESIQGGKLMIKNELGRSDIPLDQIGRIDFAAPKTERTNTITPNVRATLARGASLTLQLEKWTPEGMVASSPNIGRATFKPGSISRLQFGLFPLTRKQAGVKDPE